MTSLLWELSGGTNFDLVRNKTVLFCQCLSLSLPAVSWLGAIRGSQDCLIPITMEAENTTNPSAQPSGRVFDSVLDHLVQFFIYVYLFLMCTVVLPMVSFHLQICKMGQ